VLAFVVFGAFMWDYNDSRNEQKMMNALAFDELQLFLKTRNPCFLAHPAYPYVGSAKTKIFHRFGSACTWDISSFHLMALKNRYGADQAGYRPCRSCVP